MPPSCLAVHVIIDTSGPRQHRPERPIRTATGESARSREELTMTNEERVSILTVTVNPAIDKYTCVDQVAAERKLRCSEPRRQPGGGGINVSRAIRFLGGDSLALWTRGGPLGDLLAGLLDGEGVTHRPVPIDGMTRENLIVREENSDRHYRFGMPGPRMGPEETDRFLDLVHDLNVDPDFVVASGSLPPGVDDDFFARLAGLARERGWRLVLDTSGRPLEVAVQGEGVYLLKPNLRELRQLAGQELETESAIIEACRGLVRDGCCRVVIASLGAGGALLVTGDRTRRIAAPTVPIRSRIGAGDSMVAGLVLALSRGESIERAALFGVAAGSAAVTTSGTRLCRREETERLFEVMLARADGQDAGVGNPERSSPG